MVERGAIVGLRGMILSAIGALALVAGCTHTVVYENAKDPNAHPTAQAALDEMVPAVCARLHACVGDATFAKAYPNGESQCVDATIQKEEAKQDLSQPDACTNAQIDTCTSDIPNEACPDLLSDKAPASCNGC